MHESLTHKKAEHFCKTSIIYDKIDQNTNLAKLPSATWLFFISKFYHSKFEVLPKLLSLLLSQFLWPEKIWEDSENYFYRKIQPYLAQQTEGQPYHCHKQLSLQKLASSFRTTQHISTDKEDHEAELKPFVCFKGRSGYQGLPRFPLCLTNWIRICRVSQKVKSSLRTAGSYE